MPASTWYTLQDVSVVEVHGDSTIDTAHGMGACRLGVTVRCHCTVGGGRGDTWHLGRLAAGQGTVGLAASFGDTRNNVPQLGDV